MSHDQSKKTIFLAPAPRTVPEIFDENDLARLRAAADLVIYDEGDVTETVFDARAARAEIIIGQIDLPELRLKRATSLKAVFNVEGNFLANIDYHYCFRNAIRVLN